MKNKIFALLIMTSTFLGCNILEFDERSALEEDQVFEAIGPPRNFLIHIYSFLPRVDDYVGGALLDCATDDAEHINNFYSIQRFNTGNITVAFNPDDRWAHNYKAIQKCNTFLENATLESLDEYKNSQDPQRDGTGYYPTLVKALNYMRAEAKFLRAYFYFELIKSYGGVPIITSSDSIDFQASSYHLKRNSFEECVDFITVELNQTIPELPAKHDNTAGLQGQTGRATKGAAMALKSRVLLYAASPLFNPTNEINKWNLAAESAYSLIREKIYTLDFNYASLFTKQNSSELILERREPDSNDFERANFPIGYDGGNTGTCPSQNLVDAYDVRSTGLPITDPNSNYNPQNPYNDRDTRLYATVLTNNSSWAGRNVEIWNGGLDAPPIQNATKTGYYLKKYLNSNVKIGAGQDINQRHTWYLFRLGEIYLNFAEAANESFGPDKKIYEMSALDAVNAIRDRAMMPRYKSGMTKEEFRERIRNERRVELAFEGHRFWDVRRWKIGKETLGSDLRGMDIEKVSSNSYIYTPKIVEKRYFEEKMNLYPIPYSEVIKANIEQNPGW